MKHLKVEVNTVGRDFVVGDLHGCLQELLAIMAHVNFDMSKDRMFSVGDLIDRGAESLACLELMYAPWFIPVRGNHEQMMIDYYFPIATMYGRSNDIWLSNGGMWRVNEDHQLMQTLAKDLTELPFIITIGDRFNIVHSQLPVNRDGTILQSDVDEWKFDSDDLDLMIWNRQLMDCEVSYSFEILPTICGHTPTNNVKFHSEHINIDTGAVYGYKLTVLELVSKDQFAIHECDMTTKICKSVSGFGIVE